MEALERAHVERFVLSTDDSGVAGGKSDIDQIFDRLDQLCASERVGAEARRLLREKVDPGIASHRQLVRMIASLDRSGSR